MKRTRYQCIVHPGKWHDTAPCLCEPVTVRRVARWAGFLTATAIVIAVAIANPGILWLAVVAWLFALVTVIPEERS